MQADLDKANLNEIDKSYMDTMEKAGVVEGRRKQAQETARAAAETAYRAEYSKSNDAQKATEAATKAYQNTMASETKLSQTKEDREEYAKAHGGDTEILERGQTLWDNLIRNLSNKTNDKNFTTASGYKNVSTALTNYALAYLQNPDNYIDEQGNQISDEQVVKKALDNATEKLIEHYSADNLKDTKVYANKDLKSYTMVSKDKGTWYQRKNSKVYKKGAMVPIDLSNAEIVSIKTSKNGKAVKYIKSGSKYYLASDFPTETGLINKRKAAAATIEKINTLGNITKDDISGTNSPINTKLALNKDVLVADESGNTINLKGQAGLGVVGIKYVKKNKKRTGIQSVKVSGYYNNDGSFVPLKKITTLSELTVNDKKILLDKFAKLSKDKKYYNNKKQYTTYEYVQGGLVDYTGPAWVDGTKKKPESFLNAKQTDFVRNDLLGNSKTSLLSIVSELREILDNTSSASVDNSNSVVIENMALNFESGVISNDYSAKRAGDMAMQEILKIARKTGANTISRR